MKRNQSFVVDTLALVRNALKLVISLVIFAGWSLVLGVMTLPYQAYQAFRPKKRPGRPGSHPVSKFFRKTFEGKKVKRFVGAGLTVIMMFSGVIGNILVAGATDNTEPTLITPPETQVVTETTLEKPLEGVVAQGFNGFHRGIDILTWMGAPVKPMADGVVIESSFGRLGWGNTVVIDHGGGLRSRYAHLGQIKVIAGERVTKNQEIGTVGMTGWTTGPHLHLEIYEAGWAINPRQVLPEFNYLLAKL